MHHAPNIIFGIVKRASSLRYSTHPKVRCNGALISFDNHIVALSHGNAESCSSVRHYRNPVGCNHGHGMVVDGEFEVGIDRDIDKPKTIRSSLHKVCAESFPCRIVSVDVRSIDKSVIHRDFPSKFMLVIQRIDSLVSPILKEEIPKIFVIIGGGRPIDNESAKHSFPRLECEMRMVPKSLASD